MNKSDKVSEKENENEKSRLSVEKVQHRVVSTGIQKLREVFEKQEETSRET